jgi:hypothetical protein
VDPELAKKEGIHVRNRYYLRSVYRALHDPAAPVDPQAETTAQRVSITKDVSIVRIDHIPTQVSLPGVWQDFSDGGVVGFTKMTPQGHK